VIERGGCRCCDGGSDAEDGAFKDYVLGRLSGAALLGPAEAPSSTDHNWHGWVTLTIAPNPGLSPAQKKVIERDYGMRGGPTTPNIDLASTSIQRRAGRRISMSFW
jgi:hypothetical protein